MRVISLLVLRLIISSFPSGIFLSLCRCSCTLPSKIRPRGIGPRPVARSGVALRLSPFVCRPSFCSGSKVRPRTQIGTIPQDVMVSTRDFVLAEKSGREKTLQGSPQMHICLPSRKLFLLACQVLVLLTTSYAQVPQYGHVFIVVEENH